MGFRINGQLIALIGFTLVCLTLTFVIAALLPRFVPPEKNCAHHDVEQDQLPLTSPLGKRLTIRLNVAKTVKRPGKYLHCNANTTLTYARTPELAAQAGVTCRQYEWHLTQFVDSVTDCFDLTEAHWFGGGVMWRQDWPLSATTLQNRTAYVPGDAYQQQFGGVIERYWFSSAGFVVFVHDRVPLYVDIGEGRLCLTGSRDNDGYYNQTARKLAGDSLLAYSVCSGRDMKSLYRATRFWELPSETPARDLFERPVWSTWAHLKSNITQESVLQYARNISAYQLPAAQLEIDDKWSTNYGDHEFDASRFPQPKDMIDGIHALGYNVTLWAHPFANLDTRAYQVGAEATRGNGSFLLTSEIGAAGEPALTSWWRSANSTAKAPTAAVFDVTDENGPGSRYLENLLKRLQTELGADSFKLDAGEANWLPARSRLLGYPDEPNPGWYAYAWARFGHQIDSVGRRLEVRVGFRAQQLPLLVRAIDKDSHWDLDNGLRALVTSALTHCLIGYSFHLPDMVGGNAYCEGPDGLDGHCNPKRELYLRWLQATVFMPTIQLSVPPWEYDEEAVNITRRLLAIRSEPRFADNMAEALEDFMTAGDPVLRPMWWLNESLSSIGDQFLLGKSILVAPVMEEGATRRRVHFPLGLWRPWFAGNDSTTDRDIQGPAEKEVEVPLDSVAAFWLVKA